jgi:hypothetical protein
MRIHARAVTPARLTQRKETCHAGTRNAEEDHRDGHQLGAPEKDQLGRLLRPRKLLTYRFRDDGMRPGRSVPLSSASTYGDEVGGGITRCY